MYICHCQILVLVLLVVGAVFSVIFHIGTKEDISYDRGSLTVAVNDVKPDADNAPKSDSLQWSCWLKEFQFYQVWQHSFRDMFLTWQIIYSQDYFLEMFVSTVVTSNDGICFS